MEVKQVVALPKQLAVMDIEMSDDVLTISAVSTQASPCCPLCGKPSARIHSYSLRQVADLPCSGRQVRLLVQVRKCFCETPDCLRKIFVERLTPLCEYFCTSHAAFVSHCANHWASDRRQARSSCHGSARNTDLAPYHSPAYYGTPNRASWADY